MDNNIISDIYNNLLQELIKSYNEYKKGDSLKNIINKRNRLLYFGLILLLLGILLIPIIN